MHIVHTESSQGWGGQEIRILSESTGMLARGHRVTLLTPPGARIYEEARARGIETVALPIEFKTLKGLFAIAKWFGDNADVDVINTHSSTDSWLAGLAMAAARRPAHIVRTRHISAAVRPSLGNRWLYGKSARRVVTTGESLRRDLIDTLGLPEDHILSVSTGIDLNRFSRSAAPTKGNARLSLGLPEIGNFIGIAATLRSWKGHDDLIAAFDLLAETHPALHLAIAGDGPYRVPLENRIAASPWGKRIHLLGHCDDVPAFLAALDIFVLPSYANEGVPQAIMQAMAMGLPVVSTHIGAISDAVVDGTTGLLLPPRDPAALAQTLANLTAQPAMLETFGRAGLQRATEFFGAERMLDAMQRIFKQAVATEQ